MSVCVCVCVCERERERQTDRQTDTKKQRDIVQRSTIELDIVPGFEDFV